MGKSNYKKFFPEKVYRCSCLERVITSCLANEIYSLVDICLKVNGTTDKMIFCCKCGEDQQNAIFSCRDYIPIIIYGVQYSAADDTIFLRDETKTYCPICVKKCLQQIYYLFEHVNFKN